MYGMMEHLNKQNEEMLDGEADLEKQKQSKIFDVYDLFRLKRDTENTWDW